MKINLKAKLIFSYIFIILISFGFIAFFLDKKLEEDSLRNIQASLVTQAGLIESQIPAGAIKKQDIAGLDNLATVLSSKTKGRITIINVQGKVLADSWKSFSEIPDMENHLSRPEIKTALSGNIGSDIRHSPTLKIDMLYVALPLRENNSVTGVLRLALSLDSVRHTLSAIRATVLLGLLLALGVAFLLGFLVANRVIKPVNRMIDVSRKFARGDFSRRIIPPSRDEIGELALALNKMAEDIENKIKEIKTQHQKLAAIFDSMIEGVVVVDKKGLIVSINPAVEKIFGIRRVEAERKMFLEAIRNNDVAEVINLVLKEGRFSSAEITLVYPIKRIFEVNAAPVFDNEAIDGCILVIHDITQIRQLETVRSDFVANVSHELKTPLTSIKGFVETLLDGALDDKKNNRNFLQIIQEHSERLNSLVDDLLSLAYLESKEITLDKKVFNLKEQVQEVVAGFRSQSQRRGIEIKNELFPGISLCADRDKIKQVFTNLIDNAIKFNKEKGSIRIYTEELNGKIKIFVEDSGAGIPEKDLPRIFERFYRVDKARSRQLGGTGLGLSIVKHIVELHAGTVGVKSTEGLGSKFWFSIPGKI